MSKAMSVDSAAAKTSAAPIYAYYTEWAAGNGHFVKDLDTSGAAGHITHIVYSFANIVDGKAAMFDTEASIERHHSADESVDGTDDPDDADIYGNFRQLLLLKEKHSHLKIVYSFGGWVLSPGFALAAKNPEAFAQSAYELIYDDRWAGLFDGIDIDWEFPNAHGIELDTSGPDAYPNLMRAIRERFGNDALLTSAIGANAKPGNVLEVGNYGKAAQYLDAYLLMTYDYMHGGDIAYGPHSPLHQFDGNIKGNACTDTSVQKLIELGVPSEKILLGIGFYGRGWEGVSDEKLGGTATSTSNQYGEDGSAPYKILKNDHPATGIVGGTAYAYDGEQWWSYDTPETIATKMDYVKEHELAGAFYWETSGDTDVAELAAAMRNGLK